MSFAEIAGRVEKHSELVDLERELAALRDERDRVYAEVSAFDETIPKLAPVAAAQMLERRNVAAGEQRNLDKTIVERRAAHAAEQRKHAYAVKQVLEPHVAEQQRRIAEAFAAFLGEVAVLDENKALLRGLGDGQAIQSAEAGAKQLAGVMRRIVGGIVGADLIDPVCAPYLPTPRRVF